MKNLDTFWQDARFGLRMLGKNKGFTCVAVLSPTFGAALGVPAALGLARLVRSQLYGVKPSDPLTLALAALVLLAIAAGAAWVPARRAAGVDPMRALREE